MITLFYDNEDDEGRRSGATRLKERPMQCQRVNDDEHMHHLYDFGAELGRGTFGVVLQARSRLTGVCWAIKVIEKSQAKFHGMKLLEREIRILRLISHPNIIHLEKVYESSKKLYLVFELCTSTLAHEFNERRPFSEAETREVLRKLSSAVAYLHGNGIVHRDLKLENILLTMNPGDPADKLYIKVTDFGQSVVRSGVTHDQMLHERCGTIAYMDLEFQERILQLNRSWQSQQRLMCSAPEVMELRMYSHQCDVWSMGVIAYLLIFGEFPFIGDSPEQLKQRVLNDEPRFNRIGRLEDPVSEEAKAVIVSMLAKKPEFRITAAELCVHPWLLEIHSSVPRMNVLELMNSLMEKTGADEGTDPERFPSRFSSFGSNPSASVAKIQRTSQKVTPDRRVTSDRRKK